MTSDECERVMEVFAEARACPVEERPAFLARACADNESLRAEVESLLRYDSLEPDFLQTPAFRSGADLLAGAADEELRAGNQLGDCRIISLLGVGGMGEVYLAEDTVLGRQVAVKLIQRGFEGGSRLSRFRHERHVLAGLNHPHIARLYGGAVTPEGRAFLVMEYVEGERLDVYCRQRQLSVADRLALFRKVCAAVAYAHQNLVVHRDLKPANIRVTPEGEPKLLDFGIAKLLHPEDTLPGREATMTLHSAMTPEYASPEQLRGEPITTASDVYSLGVVLYELLAGQRPYAHLASRRPDELARAICEEEPPPPSTVAGRTAQRISAASSGEKTPVDGPASSRWRRLLVGDLDNIVGKALRKEPGRRYSSVTAFSEDIRRHCAGLPVSARRDTFGYRAGKFIRRHKAGVAAGALVVFALVVGLTVTTWQARVALRERDRAHLAERQAGRLNGFLEQLLGSIDPSHQGKDVKVTEVLDAAGRNLDRELAGEPEVLIQAHQTLSRSYSHLALFVPAEEHARAALALERSLHGADDPATAEAEVDLAATLGKRYRWADAELLLHHALGVLRRQAVPNHAALAKALQGLGLASAANGHREGADSLILEALTHARTAWGEESSNYASVLNDLAALKILKWDYAAAESIYRNLVALQDRLAPGGENSVVPLMNLCVCLFNEEKLAELRPLVDRLESDTRRLFGEKSHFFAVAIDGRGLMDAVEGNYQAAIASFRQALPMLTTVYAPGQTTVVQCRAELGLCLTRTGQAVEGEPLLRTALADGGQVDRHDFGHTFGNLENALGECLLAQGRYAEAEPLLLAGYDDLEKRLGAQHRLTIEATNRLHGFYTAWNKPAEAARYEPTTTVQTAPAP